MDNNQEGNKAPTAFLVDLVSNRKIPIATPRCRVGRDDLNDIVISGDQSISRFHFIISYENDEFTVQDAKSRHGTFLNGNQLTVSESIKDGDVLKVGVSLFWFVVEGAQSEAADPASPADQGKVSAITEDEKAVSVNSKVASQAGSDMEVTSMPPSMKSQEMTQEMQKPESGLMDKLEQAANSIKMDDKPEPKASLASLLADARDKEPDKKQELAALAARDKELLSEMDEEKTSKAEEATPDADQTAAQAEKIEAVTSETDKSEQDAAGSDEKAVKEDQANEDEIPARPTNKPSDTVTLEALNPPGMASASARVEAAKEAEGEIATSSELPSIEIDSIPPGETPAAAQSPAEEEVAAAGAAGEEKKEETELVSKGANSNTKATNAGIIDSSRDIDDDIPLARMVEETPEGDRLFSPDSGTDGQTTIEVEASALATSEPSAPQSMVEAMVADYAGESGSNGAGSSQSKTESAEESGRAEIGQIVKVSAESQDLEITKFIKAGASAVPDWCKRYFSDEIAKLNHELDDLNEQVRLAQQKIRDVETRVALTRGIRNTLLTTTGDELVEACGKVLSLLGWKVTISTEDKHELRLEVEDKHICIARVIWTTTKAERSHLGQLSISQTRYWMEKGLEPKGIIIVSKISGEAPTAVGDSPEEVELNDYAAKRNVCLMSTLQLLSLYKEIALSDASADKLRTSIVNASGWLAGHNLEPGTAETGDDDTTSNQAANKLSSLLSA